MHSPLSTEQRGNYVYAGRTGSFGDPLGRWEFIPGREHEPPREVQNLEDYRTRYRQYRSDPDLQLLHASVPFVTVWDDNDIANNAYRDGNQAGQQGAAWIARKRAAQQAWSEDHRTRVGPADAKGDLRIWRRIQTGSLLGNWVQTSTVRFDETLCGTPIGPPECS